MLAVLAKAARGEDTLTEDAPSEEVSAGERDAPALVADGTELPAIDDLPILGRGYQSLLLLVPGVVNQEGQGLLGDNVNSHGARADANRYLVDGADTTDVTLGTFGGILRVATGTPYSITSSFAEPSPYRGPKNGQRNDTVATLDVRVEKEIGVRSATLQLYAESRNVLDGDATVATEAWELGGGAVETETVAQPGRQLGIGVVFAF